MHRVSPRASLIGLALAGGLIGALLIAFMLTMGGQGTPRAQANFPNTPAGTAKPTPIVPTPLNTPSIATPTGTQTPWADAGNISGLYDLRAGGVSNPNVVVYASIYRIEEAADNTVKAAAQTVIEVPGGVGDVNAEPPGGVALPPHEADFITGPPPPPGYSSIPPSKSYGSVDANGTLTLYTCAENIGSTPYNGASLGPNLIAKIVVPHFYQQLHDNGKAMAGPSIALGQGLLLLTQKSAAECAAVAAGTFVSPDTSGMTGVPTTFYPANDADPRCSPNCVRVQWRESGNVLHGYPNWDGDLCTDAQELFAQKPGLGTKGCGDDPWSALDSVKINSADDIAGLYDLQVTLAPQDIAPGVGNLAITSITRSGSTATVTTTAAHGLTNGTVVVISGAVQPEYNGNRVIAGAAGSTFTYTVTGTPATPATGTIVYRVVVPGHYITCAAYVQKGLSGGMNVQARLLCNHDSPSEQVNPNYPGTCATSNLCADGSPGAAPPGCNDDPVDCAAASPDTAHGGTCTSALGFPPFNEPPCFDLADLTTVEWLFPPVGKPGDTYPQPAAKQTALTGTISDNTLTLAGCFRDYNNTAVDGNSYWSLKANVHTGTGVASIWRNLTAGEQTAGNCTPLTASPPGTAPGRAADYVVKELRLTRETADTCTANNAVCEPVTLAADCTVGSTAPCGFNTARWDSDGDTCPDAWELSDVTNVPFVKAGLRNPQNRWDYPDVNSDGILDIGDVSDVVQKYFIDQGYVVLSGGVNSITRLIASGSVSSITRVSSTATVTTAAAHGLPLGTGSWVRVAGASPSGYNGPKAVNVTDATHFTYLVAGTLTTPATGTITWNNRTGTVTTAAAHGLTSGTIVTLAGATQAQYNGLYPITATGGSTFTYAVTGTTAAVPVTPATGTITWATGGGGGTDNLPAGYLIDTDRTGLAGSEDWELNSPDGYVTIDDVVDSVNAYGHDCPPAGAGNLPAPNAG